MDISSLPTDNLYKFLAISGLLVLLFSYAAPEYVLLQLEIRKADVIANQQKLIIEGETIELELKRQEIDQKIEETLSKAKASKSPNIENELIAQLKSLQSTHKNLLNENKNIVEWRKRAIDQKTQSEQINILSNQIAKYSLHATIGRSLGLLITIFGFAMWYCKTQRHIDSSLSPDK